MNKIDNNLEQVSLEKEEQINKKAKSNLIADFVDFIKKYGVVGLAIGVVIGQAVTKLVNSLVDNIINKILAKFIGLVDLSNFSPYDIKVGSFITDLINFVIITFVVYLSIRFFIIKFLGEEERTKLNLESPSK